MTGRPADPDCNPRGVDSRSLGRDFVHVELEQSIRIDETNRIFAVGAISSAITDVPEPSSVVLFGPLMIAAWIRRQRCCRTCRSLLTS
ncbi:MAG: PEP-CTERM sorting domain-containing protein [Fuerstiella sp.]|nr:PEP-CTERM sorting domain-containing protein [Fuerstiella sp.]MCP4509257.1 PEP-CTERM sorting domain-containing protein [Fuerstiella sp.]